jgi:hypothetical protein
MTETAHKAKEHGHGDSVHLPSPTAWPIILAFGFTMLCAGLVTTLYITLFGAIFMVAGCVGWFRQVLPHEQHEEVPLVGAPVVIASSRALVERVRLSPEHRAQFPVETYPIGAGLKGGIAGGIAMIVPALLYGLLAHHSIWYPINLLGGAGVAHFHNPTEAQLAAFHPVGLAVASVIQIATCMLVGLLYAAMLPMLPRHPIIFGGIVAPVLWTGLIHGFLGFINPVLDAHISWPWFIVSQFTFGIVAGIVVARQTRIPTGKKLPLAVRLGIAMPGILHSRPEPGPPHDKKEKH